MLDVLITPTRAYQETKAGIHQVLLGPARSWKAMESLSPENLKEELRQMVERLLVEENLVLNAGERRNLVRDIQYEMLGFGPLEPLLADPTVSDILVNTHKQVYVERRGQLELTEITFTDDDHLMKIIDKIVSRWGAASTSRARWSMRGCRTARASTRSSRRCRSTGRSFRSGASQPVPLQVSNLTANKSMSDEMAQFIGALSSARINILISGGTGSGKTTLLNILSGYISASERIVTIEDAAELQLQQPHVVRLETRPPNIEGRGEVPQRALLRNACACGPTASSSARRAAPKRWTCCRP
jgi:pilus assembly protein CpaF